MSEKAKKIYEKLHAAADYETYMQIVATAREQVKKTQTDYDANGRWRNEMECICEFKAHQKGGIAGLDRLRRVYRNILREYGIKTQRLAAILSLSGIYNHKGKHTADGSSKTIF